MEELRIEIDRINADLENLADDGEEEEHAEDQTRKSKTKNIYLVSILEQQTPELRCLLKVKIVIISDGEGNKVTPSVVAFMNDGRRLLVKLQKSKCQ